jgi:hypothetical protein
VRTFSYARRMSWLVIEMAFGVRAKDLARDKEFI